MSLISPCSFGQPAHQAPAQTNHCYGHRSCDCRQDSSYKQDNTCRGVLEPVEVVCEGLQVAGALGPGCLLQRICKGLQSLWQAVDRQLPLQGSLGHAKEKRH